jgi:hypothetical protein
LAEHAITVGFPERPPIAGSFEDMKWQRTRVVNATACSRFAAPGDQTIEMRFDVSITSHETEEAFVLHEFRQCQRRPAGRRIPTRIAAHVDLCERDRDYLTSV